MKYLILLSLLASLDLNATILRFEGTISNNRSRLEGFTSVGGPPGSFLGGRGSTTLVADLDTVNETIAFPSFRMSLTDFKESATRQYSPGLGQPLQDFTVSFSFDPANFIFRESTQEMFALSQTTPGGTEYDILGMPRDGKPYVSVTELRLTGRYLIEGPTESINGLFDILLPDDPRFFYNASLPGGFTEDPTIITNGLPNQLRMENSRPFIFAPIIRNEFAIISETVDGVLIEESLTTLQGLRRDAFFLDFSSEIPEPSSVLFLMTGSLPFLLRTRRQKHG